jgi:hypothetical protein
VGSGFESQLHDFNPGITSSGLFWTVAVPESAVDVQPGSGQARMQVGNLSLRDAFTVGNALFGGGPTPIAASASFDVRWLGGGDRDSAEDSTVDFVFKSVGGDAHIDWSAANSAGFNFASSASGQETVFAAVGKERNGVFF